MAILKKYFTFALLVFILNSCKNNSDTEKIEAGNAAGNIEKIEQLSWLLGTWIFENGETYSQETWSKEHDSAYTAFSFTQVAGETVFAETMALELKTENLWLTVASVNQNEGKPVTFKLISSENNRFIFENKKHGFPERIVYTNPVKDSLHAWIEGTENGEFKKVDFHFSRKH